MPIEFRFIPSHFVFAAGFALVSGGAADALPAPRGLGVTEVTHPFASAPLRHLFYAISETTTVDKNPELDHEYLREGFVGLVEWLAPSTTLEA